MGSRVCDEIESLLDIEGHTQIGMVQKLQVYSCGKRKSYIVVELVDGRRICSPCLDEDVIKPSARFIDHYSKNIKLVVDR